MVTDGVGISKRQMSGSNTENAMEPISVNQGPVDSDTLMVIIKQEEEEHEEEFTNPQMPSLLLIKHEKEEEQEEMVSSGHATPPPLNSQPPKIDPDTLEGERKGKKTKWRKKKRRRDEKVWSPPAVVGSSVTDSMWRCRLCKRSFSSSWVLTGHCCTGIVDGDTARRDCSKLEYRCPVCGDRFLRPTAFIMHKRSHVGQSRYVCGICGRTLKTLRKLASHRRSHSHGPLPHHRCQDCRRSFLSLAALRGHRQSRHGEEPDEEEEEEDEEEEEGTTRTSPNKSGSILAQLPQSPQCLSCFMTFRDAETAERHLRFKHPAEYERQLRGSTVFACSVCDRTFPSSRLLSAHQRTHSKWSLTPSGSDDSLQEKGGDKGNLKMKAESSAECHIADNAEGDQSGAGLMRCLHCHIIFTDPRTWERHMIAKHPPSPSLALPGSASPGYLSMRPPRGQPRPYSCPNCGERFIQESSLTKHYTETHTS